MYSYHIFSVRNNFPLSNAPHLLFYIQKIPHQLTLRIVYADMAHNGFVHKGKVQYIHNGA